MNPKLLTQDKNTGILCRLGERMQYNTKKRKAITDFFKIYSETWFTAEQVAVAMDGIGRSTVYRVITELCEQGTLVKEYSDNKNCFVFKADKKACHEHFHMKCVSCGKYVHVEDKLAEEMIGKIAGENDFMIDKSKTVLYGTCKECRKKESV